VFFEQIILNEYKQGLTGEFISQKKYEIINLVLPLHNKNININLKRIKKWLT